jgi:phosphoribosyl 1,2-cyclic phosphodiesterase
MRVVVLGSGSRGNVAMVEAGGARILIDAGIPVRTLRERFASVLGEETPHVDGIVLTHAHGDHAGHAAATAAELGAPLFMTRSTQRCLAGLEAVRVRVFGPSARFTIGPLEVLPCPIPHDAPQVAIVIGHGDSRAAIVTDVGEPTTALQQHLRGCDAVLIESNHDLGMLMEGPYPESLKRRVGGPLGHLNNQQTASVLRKLGRETSTIVLLHISERNNTPELAHAVASEAIGPRRDVRILVAEQDSTLQVQVQPRPRPMKQLELPLPLLG